MNSSNLVSEFKLSEYHFDVIHSTGTDILVDTPRIAYLRKGSAKFLYRGNTYFASVGDLIYIPVDTKYQSIWYGTPDIEWYAINFDFNSRFAFYNYRFQIIKNYPADIFDKIRSTYQTSPILSVSHFYQLLSDIYQKMEYSPYDNIHSPISPAISYIEKNFNKAISIKELEKLCHISKSALFMQFHKQTGVTPIEYKHNIMIQNAIYLLNNSSLSIEEISQKVGFASSNYFRKVFIKLTDKTPKEIRKKN